MLEECLGISNLANIFFVRQKQTLGLGHAVSMAKAFTGDDPVRGHLRRRCDLGARILSAPSSSAPMRSSAARLPVSPLCPRADVSRYCSLKTTPIHDNYFFVDAHDRRSPKRARSSATTPFWAVCC